MLDPAISDFLHERKAAWLKGKIKANSSDDEISLLTGDANTKYSPSVWISDAAKRAKQLSIVSHPGKFTHPDAKISPVNVKAHYSADGLLRSGNAVATSDVIGNAAALDVFKFLSIALSDEQTVLQHLQSGSEEIRKQFNFKDIPYDTIKENFLMVLDHDDTLSVTNGRVKQVYFPIDASNVPSNDGAYHLLSVLTPSGLMFELKQRLNDMRFSDDAKQAKDAFKKDQPSDVPYCTMNNLTAIGYGGSKPQNISNLNSKNYGTTLLLPSLPPIIEHRKVQFPKTHFFEQSIRQTDFERDFSYLAKLLTDKRNNMALKQRQAMVIKQITLRIAGIKNTMRQQEHGWSQRDYFSQLPSHQKIWLDDARTNEREANNDWYHAMQAEIVRWLISSTNKKTDDNNTIGDHYLSDFGNTVALYKEVLR